MNEWWPPQELAQTLTPGQVVLLWGQRFVVVYRSMDANPRQVVIKLVPQEDVERRERPVLHLVD